MCGANSVLWKSRGAAADDVVHRLRISTPTLPGQRSDWRISEHHEYPRARPPDSLQGICTMTDDTAPHQNGVADDLAALAAQPPAPADLAPADPALAPAPSHPADDALA